jgi:hypothetical protein
MDGASRFYRKFGSGKAAHAKLSIKGLARLKEPSCVAERAKLRRIAMNPM